MAIYYARKAGNINATDVWATTPTGTAGDYFGSFTNADTLVANSFTVTLNVNTTVLEVRTDTTGGATAGGSFTLNNGITLNANVIAGSTNNCVNYNGASPNSATIIGSLTGGNGSSQSAAAVLNGTGTLNIVGNVSAGSGTYSWGINILASNGTINLTGNINGGSGGFCYGINLYTSSCICNVTGNATGGTNSTAYGIYISAVLILNLTGSAIGGSVAPGIVNNASSTVTATRAKGNGFGNGSVGLTAQVGVSASQNSLTRVYEIEYGDLGQTPTSGPISFFNDSSNKALFYRPNLTKKTLVDSAASLDLPSVSNVRNGTSYNFGSNVGTCVIPPASSVAYGVAVDNTTGTATLTPQSIWDFLISNISASNSIGERLKNAATIDSVSSQVITIKGS